MSVDCPDLAAVLSFSHCYEECVIPIITTILERYDPLPDCQMGRRTRRLGQGKKRIKDKSGYLL